MKLEKSEGKTKGKNYFQIQSALDGSLLGTYRESSVNDLVREIGHARAAAARWRELRLKERLNYIKNIRSAFAERSGEIVDVVHRECGKVIPEIYGAEIIANLELLNFYIRNSARMLKKERISINPINYPRKKGYIIHRPHGLVGVISSWNFPVALAMRAIVPALVAGNGVVFKASPNASLIGDLLGDIFRSCLPAGLFITAFGNKEVNQAVVDNVDKVNFIGSVATGVSVAERCAGRLIPCSTELSGKDAAIVLEDCNLERTVNGVLWGAFTNSGQNCASIERVFIVQEIYDQFLHDLVEKTKRLRPEVDYGPLRSETQVQLVLSHLDDAKKSGAKILCGGKRREKSLYIEPAVIAVRDPHAMFMQEETFGPTLPVYKVKDLNEAVALTNSARFGLTTSVWTEDKKNAETIAARLESGIVTFNNSVFTGALAAAPWGGVKQTGHGVTNSKYGLLEMTRPHLLLIDNSRQAGEAWWYPYSQNLTDLLRAITDTFRGKLLAFLKVPGLLKKVLKEKL